MFLRFVHLFTLSRCCMFLYFAQLFILYKSLLYVFVFLYIYLFFVFGVCLSFFIGKLG